MATVFKRAMLYLGLGPDEDYEDYDQAQAAAAAQPEPPAPARTAAGQPARRPVQQPTAQGASVRQLPTQPAAAPAAQRPVSPGARPAAVRPVRVGASKPMVVSPTQFNEAQEVADKFKANQPVIMNLQGVDKASARRLIDFASGLCYGVGGTMERVASNVFLLTPTNVEVSKEDRRALQERGLHDG